MSDETPERKQFDQGVYTISCCGVDYLLAYIYKMASNIVRLGQLQKNGWSSQPKHSWASYNIDISLLSCIHKTWEEERKSVGREFCINYLIWYMLFLTMTMPYFRAAYYLIAF